MILGTAGHIDHGKTSLVKALTGVDTDRLPEEKRRGITIDLGFAPLSVDGVGTIGIVDVPGHEGFIRTMLAGASGIDIALLVIAADESVMPQTREHLDILSLLGIQHMVVALTKSDLVGEDWLDLVVDDVEMLLAATRFNGSRIVAVSARTGHGIPELRAAIASAALGVPPRGPDDDLFRMPVDRVFTVKGTGTVATGTIWSGSVSREATMVLRPGDKIVRVRAVQTHGASVTTATAGERAALALAGCDVTDVSRGSVLVGESGWTGTSELEAEIDIAAIAPRVTSRTRLRFHLGTADIGCRISGAGTMGGTGVATNGRVRIVLDDAVIARGGDRFVLRYPSPPLTIGGGRVVDPYPPRRRRAGATGADRQSSGLTSPDNDPLSGLLASAGTLGVRLSTLPVRIGLPVTGVAQACDALGAITIDGRVYTAESVSYVADSLEKAIFAHAETFSIEPGVSLQTLRASVGAPAGVIDFALSRLSADKRIELDRALARPAGWKPKLDSSDQALSDAIMHEICIQPNEPPSVQELCGKFGDRASALLRKLDRDGELERVSDERYYSRAAVAGIVGIFRSKLLPGQIYSPAELREILGVSRKYLIPLLEYCDRARVTERRREGRAILPERARQV